MIDPAGAVPPLDISGETLLWQGRPNCSPSLHPRPPASVIFFDILLIALLAGPGLWAMWNFDPGALWLKLLILAFLFALLLSGLNGIGGYALTRAWIRRYTRYFLTNKQAVIYIDAPLLPVRIESHPITALTPLILDDRPPGSVWFATHTHRFGDEISRTLIGTTPYGFDRIPDAREVYKRMRSLQTEAS